MNDLSRRPNPARPTSTAPEIRGFERLLAELSARFVNLPADRVNDEIVDALRKIVLLLDVDRCQLIRLAEDGDDAFVTHSWAVEGVPAVPPKSIKDFYPWGLTRQRAGFPVVAPTIDALPDGAAVDKASFRSRGVQSHLGIPMKVGGKVVGVLAFGCLRRQRDWPEELVDRIGILADVFANALAHKRAQEALERAVAFERAVSEIQSALLKARPTELDDVIVTGLREIAAIFGAERATLWQHAADRRLFAKTHRWIANGVPDTPDRVPDSIAPWIVDQLLAGSTVSFPSLSQLPPEAGADLPGLRALHVNAGVAVPLAVGGSVVGALSFGMVRGDHEWPADLVGRVKLVGEVFAGVIARRDAERREFQAQAEAAHAARVGTMGVVVASLVHELTQPITAGLANAETAVELVAAPVPDIEELRATATDILADARRAGELIQQLRRFLRRGEAERTEFELGPLIDDVLRLARSKANELNIEITSELPDALPAIEGDRIQLQQVLLNLLLNAFDAVAQNEPAARRVAVRTVAASGGVSVEVRDSGRGMDEPTFARIFEPFFTTKPRGMGLGLSISRTILEAHGGTLSAQSAPGRGTSVRFELPLRPPGQVRPAPQAQAQMGKGSIVYVIDDDPSMRRAVERHLEGSYRVETFPSAQAFLEQAPPDGVACIVSDVAMPGLNGLELQETLARAERPLPIVFISGLNDVPITAQAMKAGAVNFLAKPFSRSDLLAAVTEALAQCREVNTARLERAALTSLHASLTPREREVFALVAAGLLNKTIADRLGTAEATVKIHRGRVMEKLGVASVADLVRMAERLGVTPVSASLPR